MGKHLMEGAQFYQLSSPGTRAAAATSAATTPAELDMQSLGYDSVVFFASAGTTEEGIGIHMTMYVGGTTVLALATSAGTTGALTVTSTYTKEIIYIDAKQVQHRYVGVTYSATTATDFSGVTALLYNSREVPVALSTDVASTGSNAVITTVQPTTTV